MANPVESVALVELGPLGGVILLAPVKDYARTANRLCAVGRQLAYGKHRVESGTASCPSVHQIATAVVVPQRAWINHSLALNYAHGLLTLAVRITRLHHENAVVGVAPVDVQLAVVMAYGWRPYALAVLRTVEQRPGQLLLQGVAYDLPVDEVFAV